MASLALKQVAKQNFIILGLIQTINVTKAVTQPPQQIIKHTALSLFRCDDYQAIYRATLLSYVLEVDVWLGKHCDFFG